MEFLTIFAKPFLNIVFCVVIFLPVLAIVRVFLLSLHTLYL